MRALKKVELFKQTGSAIEGTRSFSAFIESQPEEVRKLYELEALQNDLALLIKEERIKTGRTQQQIADSLKTTKSVISRIERGDQNLSFRMVCRIAAVFGKKPKIFFE